MCGCGPMSTPPCSVTDAGPNRSTKHHAPTVRRCRRGSTRWTVIAPTCASCGSTSSMSVPPLLPVVTASSVVTGPLMSLLPYDVEVDAPAADIERAGRRAQHLAVGRPLELHRDELHNRVGLDPPVRRDACLGIAHRLDDPVVGPTAGADDLDRQHEVLGFVRRDAATARCAASDDREVGDATVLTEPQAHLVDHLEVSRAL